MFFIDKIPKDLILNTSVLYVLIDNQSYHPSGLKGLGWLIWFHPFPHSLELLVRLDAAKYLVPIIPRGDPKQPPHHITHHSPTKKKRLG